MWPYEIDFNRLLRPFTSAHIFPAVLSLISPLVCSLQSSFCIFPLVCGLNSAFNPCLHFTLSLQSAFYPWSAVHSPQSSFYTDRICICCERFVFAVSNLYWMWTIWIWCERFEFAVSDFEFAVSDLNLLWVILNLMWVIWIWCEHYILFWCDICGPPYKVESILLFSKSNAKYKFFRDGSLTTDMEGGSGRESLWKKNSRQTLLT